MNYDCNYLALNFFYHKVDKVHRVHKVAEE